MSSNPTTWSGDDRRLKVENRKLDMVDAEFSYRLESAEWLPSLDFVDRLAREDPELGAAKQMVAGGWMAYCGVPVSPLNHMVGMGLQGPVSAADMDQVEEFYRERQCPFCEIVVSPYAHPTLIEQLGERAGYRITEFNSVLVRRIYAAEHFDTRGFNILRVQPADALRWAEIVAQGFADLWPLPPDFFVPFATPQNAICFLAYADGKPVGGAGGSVFPEHGIAPLYGASTLPAFRNRGIHNALFRARLRAAAEAGCELAVMSTLPGSGSQRNAERNGFRLAYTKIVTQKKL